MDKYEENLVSLELEQLHLEVEKILENLDNISIDGIDTELLEMIKLNRQNPQPKKTPLEIAQMFFTE